MNKKATRTNNPILRNDAKIGEICAENDEFFLSDCFIYHNAVDEICDSNSSKMILAGRTGSGKTAILDHIKRSHPSTAEVVPSEMSMHYISNSDILRFLNDIGANLDMFFQVLWKHVLVVEYIKLKYYRNTTSEPDSILSRISHLFKTDKKKQTSIDYMEKWGTEFWITIDESVKAITETYEKDVSAELEVDVNKFKTRAGYGKNLSVEQKREYIARAQKVINHGQLTALANVVEALSEGVKQDHGRGRTYYLLIDQLDINWVDESIRFRLINALVQVLQKFRKIHDLKIIVALRSDVLERAIQENNDLGFQSEKYRDYISDIKWSRGELKSLVQKRIGHLFKKKYTRENVEFVDIFTHKIGREDPFEYILSRTLYRPRDTISFVNECLRSANNNSEVVPKFIKSAESEYSGQRLTAVIEEWKAAFPTLEHVLHSLRSGRETIQFTEFCSKSYMEKIAIAICEKPKVAFDPLYKLAEAVAYNDCRSSQKELARYCVEILYRVGVVGVKQGPESGYIYSHIDSPAIGKNSLSEKSLIRVHKMLHQALSIDVNTRRHRS